MEEPETLFETLESEAAHIDLMHYAMDMAVSCSSALASVQALSCLHVLTCSCKHNVELRNLG